MHFLDRFLQTPSPIPGMLIVAVISAILAMASSWVRPPNVRWTLLCGAPLVLAYFLYWHVAKLEGGPIEEYKAWQFVFLIFWGGPGILSASVVSTFIQKHRKKAPEPSA